MSTSPGLPGGRKFDVSMLGGLPTELPFGETVVRGGRVSFLESKDRVELEEEGRDGDRGGSGPTVLVDAQSPIFVRCCGW